MSITKYGLFNTTMESLSSSPSTIFTGGPLGMDRTCVPKRIVIMDLATDDAVPDDDRPVSWNTTQNVEVVVGQDPASSGREMVVQILVPPLYIIGKHFKGKHIPIPRSQHEFTDKAFAFNSCPFHGIDFRYVAEEVDVHRHLYKQAFIGFEPVRLSLLHNLKLFPFYDDDAGIPTPLCILYKVASTLFGGLADLIAVNAVRRRCEEETRMQPNSFHSDGKPLIARGYKDPRVEAAMLEVANSWTEWGKKYLPQSFLAPTESVSSKKKGTKNAAKRRPAKKSKSDTSKVSKTVRTKNRKDGKAVSKKKVPSVRKGIPSRNKKNVRG